MNMRWIRVFWDAYERLFAFVMRFYSVAPGSLIRVRSMTYRGRPLRSGDAALLSGQRVLELHLDNKLIEKLGATGSGAAFYVREHLREQMPLLLRAVREASPPVAGVFATSLVAVGARGLGFHVEPEPTEGLANRWLAAYMRWLARLYRVQAPSTEDAPAQAERGVAPSAGAAGGAVQHAGHAAQPARRKRIRLFTMWLTTAELERLVEDGVAPTGSGARRRAGHTPAG